MYDSSKRKNLSGTTVADLIAELSKLPGEAQVVCCGDDYVWLHVEKDGSVVCIDTEDLEECYDC